MNKIKKTVILFLLSLFAVVLFSCFVSAGNNLTITLANVNNSKSVTDAGVQYINNGTYHFNFTIDNNKSMNISLIRFTLPLGFQFVAGTNGTNSTSLHLVVFNYTSYDAATQQNLTWNSSVPTTPLINMSSGLGCGVYFGFEAIVSLAATSDGPKNFTILTMADASTGENHAINETYLVLNNITVDNTRPTLSSAVTKSGSTINITFSEPLNLTDAEVGNINISILNGSQINGTWTVHAEISSFTPASTVTDSISLLAISSIGFPTNYSDWLNITVNGTLADRAGNTVIAKSSVTATDGAPPGLINATYSYYTRQLILVFNESVTALNLSGNLNITEHNRSGRKILITTISSNLSTANGTANSTTITVNISTRDIISGWRTNSFNVSFNRTFLKDLAGNDVLPNVQLPFGLNTYVNDTTLPNMTIASFKYDHNTLNLTLVFNETMDLSDITVASIFLHNSSDATTGNTKNISLADAVFNTAVNSTEVNITLTVTQQANVSSWVMGDASARLYLSINRSIRDLGGNDINGVSNTSAVLIPTYTKDNVAPYLKNISLSNATFYINDEQKLQTPVKAGIQNFTITFSEIMSMNTTTTLTYTPSGGSAVTVPCSWFNDTSVNCSFAVTSSTGDGWATVSVSAAKDISRINTMAANGSTQFKIDTTAPKLIRVFNNRSNYALVESNFTGDALVLEFNENVSLAGFMGLGITNYNGVNNDSFSSYIDNISNLTVASDLINESRITSDNATSGKYRIVFLLNDSVGVTTLTVRGTYNKNRVAAGDPSGIDVRNTQSIIVDNAGNPAVPNGSHIDIADGIIHFVANVSKTVSAPYCVNGSLMDQALSGATWACSSYTTGAWSNAISSSSSIVPLKGYKCTISSSDLEYYIYTENKSNCALSSVSLNQNWNLVSVDGGTQANATRWFAGLGDGSEVPYWYTNIDPHANIVYYNSTTPYTDQTANPLTGFWIFTDFNLATKNWAGRGLY